MNKLLPMRLSIIVSVLLMVCALSVTTVTLYVLVISHWHGPFRDMWEIYPFLQKIMSGTWGISDLWESYGYSHRLFIPRLLFIADHQFFSATNHLLIAVSVFCQMLICILFSLFLFKDSSLATIEKYGLIAVVVCLQFSGTLLFNLMHTFDVQWFVCCLFIVLAFCKLSELTASASSAFFNLAVAGFFIVLACLCNFSAMAAWPIWGVLVFSKSNNLKLKIILLSIALFFVAFYVSGVRTEAMDHGSIGDLAKLISYILVIFPFAYLSNPLSDSDFISFGFWSAVIVLPAVFVLFKFWRNYFFNRDESTVNQLNLFLACIGFFGYGVAVITAIGRGYDFSHVHAMRYQNIVLLFWSAVILLAILETRALKIKIKYFVRFPFAITLLGFLWCQPPSWNQNLWLGYQVNRAHLALMMGFSNDVPMIAPTVSRSMIYVSGYNLEHERVLYEKARKGIYQGEQGRLWLDGVSLAQIEDVCQGVTWTLSPYEGAYTRYISFSVSGNPRNFNIAALVDDGGKVLAMAIPEETNNFIDALRFTLELKRPVLRGFALSEVKPAALVLLHEGTEFDACTAQLK